jgi:hypothetical protein
VWGRLGDIRVPTLMVGAAHDAMNPAEMEGERLVQKGRYLFCRTEATSRCGTTRRSSNGVISFIKDVHEGRPESRVLKRASFLLLGVRLSILYHERPRTLVNPEERRWLLE